MSTEQQPATIRSLVCHRDVEMAVACLGSLLRFSRDPLRLVLHEDGSLTDADVARLSERLPVAGLIRRRDADDEMDDRLGRHPRARRYRYRHPLALKLLDVPLLSDGDMAFCDTDVLFVRPFRDLLRWPDPITSIMFMADGREAYSVRPWELMGRDRVHLVSRVNSGLIAMRARAYDLDFVEWCLGRFDSPRLMMWMEQTCWSAIGCRAACRLWDESQIAVMRPRLNVDDNIAVHFTSRVRSFLPAAIERLGVRKEVREVAQVRTVVSRECRPLDVLSSQARHEFGILRHRMLSRVRQVLPANRS